MRDFFYITLGKLMERLKEEGVPVSRSTMIRLEERGLFELRRLPGGWRVASKTDLEAIVKILKDLYQID